MKHELQLLKNQIIFKSQHLYSVLTQKSLPITVVSGPTLIKMHFAVQFDRHPLSHAEEIQYVGPNAMLPPKLASVEF